MKIIKITLIVIFSFISTSLAKEYIKDFDFNDADFIQSKYDVKYFIHKIFNGEIILIFTLLIDS